MAIRDRFRRAMHKSDSSNSLAQTESNNTITTTPTIATTSNKSETSSQESSLRREPTNQTSKFSFPWSKTDSEKAHKKEEKDKKKQKKSNKPIHPRDKPMTATNIRYQEQLGDWDFAFGSSPNRLSQLITDESSTEYGVSPCCTRPASINGDAYDTDPLSPVTEVSNLQEPPKA